MKQDPELGVDAFKSLKTRGPIGFIAAVDHMLRYLDRPYYFGPGLPEWLDTKAEGETTYSEVYGRDVTSSLEWRPDPHAIVYGYTVTPARLDASRPDASGGPKRHRAPLSVLVHPRPLPESGSGREDQEYSDQTLLHGSHRNLGDDVSPLWPSKEDIPDMIRPYVTAETPCYVYPRKYSVLVDFTVVSPDPGTLETVHADLLQVLYTFFDRSHTGASNLAGTFYDSRSDAPSRIMRNLRPGQYVRTVRWELVQEISRAFPATMARDLKIKVHGQ